MLKQAGDMLYILIVKINIIDYVDETEGVKKMEWKGYMRGVNFGCWLCQCDGTRQHYDTHITEADFFQVRKWGCDHVRIPFSYIMVTEYKYAYLDRRSYGQHGLD